MFMKFFLFHQLVCFLTSKTLTSHLQSPKRVKPSPTHLQSPSYSSFKMHSQNEYCVVVEEEDEEEEEEKGEVGVLMVLLRHWEMFGMIFYDNHG